jgi:hypothetical protein
MTMNTSITSNNPPTDGQVRQYKDLVAAAAERAAKLALEKSNVDKEGMQRILTHGDEIREAVAEVVISKTNKLSIVPDKFAAEEVDGNFGYPEAYQVKGIAEQVCRLKELFPDLGYPPDRISDEPPANGAEGWFAIPRWQKIGKTYGEALERVLALISETRNGEFRNNCADKLDSQHLRMSEKTAKAFEKLNTAQDSDILIVAAQSGKLRVRKSTRRVKEVLPGNEFGLDPFSAAVILLTHPERLQKHSDLWVVCAGGEYANDISHKYDMVPGFFFSAGKVRFTVFFHDIPSIYYGIATGIIPQ